MARLKYYNANTNEWIYADLAVQAPGTGLPDAPTTDGDYVLSLEVDDGDNTYTWETPSSGGGAGITYDVTISGTATGDVTNLTDWTTPNATYIAKTTVPSMLAKIRSTGKIDFDGGLTKSTTGALGFSVTQYYLPIIQWCEIMSAADFATLAGTQQLTADGVTEGIVIHAAGLNASGEYEHDFMLIIGVLQGGTTICMAI
ncbi:MAG: hypothetical protein J6T96_05630 [Bacteroidales bacterium]|nr:hypothetical protein [Bacteroidales bacterium]